MAGSFFLLGSFGSSAGIVGSTVGIGSFSTVTGGSLAVDTSSV